MSVLSKEADVLRASAARLDAYAADAPRSAKDLIRRFAPSEAFLTYQQRIELELANEPGVALGVEVGKILRAVFTGLRMPNQRDPFCPLMRSHVAEYEAKVVVLTPAQLESIVEKAFRAGREAT